MKNARITSLSLAGSLALANGQFPTSVLADAGSPELPPYERFDGVDARAVSARDPALTRITPGVPATGVIGDDNDFVNNDGTVRSDFYVFDADTATPYRVTVLSGSFIAESSMVRNDLEVRRLVPHQTARVWAAGTPVQYSGLLGLAGTWFVRVTAVDGGTGPYIVSLDQGVPGAGCAPASSDNPLIEVTPGTILNCELQLHPTQVFNLQDGPHYYEAFHFTGDGTSVTIAAASSAFRPLIVLVDPATGQALDPKAGAVSGAFTGDVVYLVTSAEPNATGPFHTGVHRGAQASVRHADSVTPDLMNYQIMPQ